MSDPSDPDDTLDAAASALARARARAAESGLRPGAPVASRRRVGSGSAGGGRRDGRDFTMLGAQVEVEGRMRDGVLVAHEVELESPHAGAPDGFELHGSISALDAANGSFMLRGVRVSYAGNPVYEDGSAASLANGRRVEVKGRLSADRSVLQASVIEFED